MTIVSFAQSSAVTKDNKNKVFEWTTRYMQAYPTEAYAHMYGKRALNELLQTAGLQKILVFNGLDGEGMPKIVFKAAGNDGKVIAGSNSYDVSRTCPPSCPKALIDEIGSVIDEGLAVQYIEKFQSTYTMRPQAQLFTREQFEKILAQPAAEGMYLGRAIDETGNLRVVLAGLDGTGNVMWDGVVIDNGTPIPSGVDLGYPVRDIVSVK